MNAARTPLAPQTPHPILDVCHDTPRVTGRMPEMLQDCSRKLSKWLSSRIDSRMHAREAARSQEVAHG